jgi:hypothetical protein
MTVSAFLIDVARIFDQPTFDSFMARQARDYATIALNLEDADARRREDLAAATATAARAGLATLAKERKKRAAKATR